MLATDVHTDVSLMVLGARGSIPVSGAEYLKYGGSTTCAAVVSDTTVNGLLDAGTGLMALRDWGLELHGAIPIFLTHYHWDHIQGVSMLGEVWSGACSFTIIGPGDTASMIKGAIRPPWFPVSLDDAPEPLIYGSIDGMESVGAVAVSAFDVQHPQGAVGYLLRGPNRSIAIVTDHESGAGPDAVVAAAIDGVDVLIHDAQYLPAEVDSHRGWGHSTWEDAARMALRVGASELLLTSHDPSRSDREIDATVEQARLVFPNTSAASPGLKIPL